MSSSDTQKLAQAVCDGDRRALGRAITLVEAIREDHREQAERLQVEHARHNKGARNPGKHAVNYADQGR